MLILFFRAYVLVLIAYVNFWFNNQNYIPNY